MDLIKCAHTMNECGTHALIGTEKLNGSRHRYYAMGKQESPLGELTFKGVKVTFKYKPDLLKWNEFQVEIINTVFI